MSSDGLTTFSCKSCDQTYPQHLDLQIHIAKVHQKPKSFRDLGIKISKDENKRAQGLAPMSCQSCGMKFKRLNLLKTHILREHKVKLAKKIAKCDFCDKIFPQSDDLENHKNSVHKDEISQESGSNQVNIKNISDQSKDSLDNQKVSQQPNLKQIFKCLLGRCFCNQIYFSI